VEETEPLLAPPEIPLPGWLQGVRFGVRPLGFNLKAQRRLGDVWQLQLMARNEPFVVTAHPDHVKSLFTAKPEDAPSLTGESPLRPILGPNSVLTLTGERHMRQRKLLLPAFHGEAVQGYVAMISEVIEREIDSWHVGEAFALAPRMQRVTLDVIMSGIFGIEGTAARGSIEHRLRETFRRLLRISTHPLWSLVELQQLGREDPRGIGRVTIGLVDRVLYELIRERRAAHRPGERRDVLALLLDTRDDDGQALTDEELRDELMTLVLAGHETTANSLAWTFERLVRFPGPYSRLRELVRGGSGEEVDAYVEATIYEGMRVRPVIPIVVRQVKRRWRLGSYVVPSGTPVALNIIAVHHRPDVYPDPLVLRPERFLHHKQPDDPGADHSGEAGCLAVRKPGTYTWIPFGGGIRRCLGAALAMAEQRIVLSAIARRTDLEATDPRPERARLRNVTMIPRHGGHVVLERKLLR
jgi:cytochrome P450